MLPVIALVGRPNVGKSTLFNRLTGSRDALVADYPGLTRDRKYGKSIFADHAFIVIDTGGIGEESTGQIDSYTTEQSLTAIEEADIVLYIVDARAGLMDGDKLIAQQLRIRKKATFVVANKIDGLDKNCAIAEFYALGLGGIYAISASHGRGVTSLIQQVFADEHSTIMVNANESDDSANQTDNEGEHAVIDEGEGEQDSVDSTIKIAIVGKPNVGKSTLTNRILGEDRVIVFDMPGTTRDSIYIPMKRGEQNYIVIDTAGVRKRAKVTETVEKFSVIKTLQAIEDANVVLLVIDAREGVTDQDLSLLGFIINSGRSLVIAVNKWDGLSQDVKQQIKEALDERLGFVDFARIHFISALHGSGVGNLFESIDEAFNCATRRVNTSLLTKIMQMAQDDHQPPLVQGRRVKLKYAHAGGYNPPIIVIHGNQVDDLPQTYKRYLMNYFRRSLKLMGTPIQMQFKVSENPFAGRRNTLTPTQQRKRRRLMKYIKAREG